MPLLLRLVLTVFVCWCAPAQTAPAPTAGSIAGVVRDSVTGSLIGQVAILVTGPSGRRGATADANGNFRFDNLQPGLYQITAHGTAAVLATRSVTVEAGREATNMDLRVAPLGSIAGRLLDENREPVTGLQVVLVGGVYRSGTLQYETQGAAVANAKGEYVIRNVRAGAAYYLLATGRSVGPLEAISTEPADPEERKPALAEAWFPDAASVDDATPVTLFPGENRENLVIRVRRFRPRCIEATLENALGPASMEYSVFDHWRIRLSAGVAGADGRIRICRPERTKFRIVAFDQNSIADVAIPAGDRDVIGLRIVPQPERTVQGRVAWEGEPPPGSISIGLAPSDRLARGSEMNAKARVSIPGSFTLSAMGDDHALSISTAGVPAGVYVNDVTHAGSRVENGRLRLAGDGELLVSLGRDAGALSVVVQDGNHQPVPDVWVVVMPFDTPSESALSTSLHGGQSNRFGGFAVSTIKPGKYLVIATASWLDLNRETIARLWRARNKAREIEIAPNAAVRISVGVTELQ